MRSSLERDDRQYPCEPQEKKNGVDLSPSNADYRFDALLTKDVNGSLVSVRVCFIVV